VNGARGGSVRRRLAGALWLLALVAGGLASAPTAAAEPLGMTEVRVQGGEGAWNPNPVFRIDWTQAPGPPAYPRALMYRLYSSDGQLVDGPVRESDVWQTLSPLAVPQIPDVYKLEMWLEDFEGHIGPPSSVKLRFDDTAPAAPVVVAPPGWLTSRKEARLQVEPPAQSPPAGIRGYAISLDQGAGGLPCARPSRCTVAETDFLSSGGGSIPLGWLPEGSTFVRIATVSGSGVASAPLTVPLRLDGAAPAVTLDGLPHGWSNGPVRLTATASDRLSGMAASGPGGPFTAIAVDDDVPAEALGDAVSTWVTGSGLHAIAYFGRDAAGNIDDGNLGPDPATASVAIDEEPPEVVFAAAQDPAEPERIEATVADPLSGPSPDRGSIGLRPAGSRSGYRPLPTRVSAGRLVAVWDSDSYPPGKYELLATGYDRAGNARTGYDRARGARMVLVNPLKKPMSLEAGFGGRHRSLPAFDERAETRTVPLGAGVRFGGRLTALGGGPRGGLEVAVTESFAPGSDPPRRTTTVRTEPDGTFSLPLLPGPSRDISAAFAGTRTLTEAGGRTVHLGVLGRVRLRASAAAARIGGAPIVFIGSVDPAGVAGSAAGLPVELQFRYPGAGWSEFRTVGTNARGRFRYAYRFSDDDSRGVRFQFRAVAGQKEGWPYEPAFSRPITVTGR
jgi:hypothetical protein